MDEGKATLEHRLKMLEARVRCLETLVEQRWAETPGASGSQRPPNGSGHEATQHQTLAPNRRGAASRPGNPVAASAALEAFPHVIQTLVLTWGHPECESYLARLVVDERGCRRGFPVDALDELLFLSELLRFRNPMARLSARPGKSTNVWEESAGRRGRPVF